MTEKESEVRSRELESNLEIRNVKFDARLASAEFPVSSFGVS
jgi:hypothetical protein